MKVQLAVSHYPKATDICENTATCVHVLTCTWQSEDSLQELFLPVLLVGPGPYAGQQAPLPTELYRWPVAFLPTE